MKRVKTKRRLLLTSVTLAGFKAIKDSNRIPIGRLTLLIGRNGSGKSSIVEGLQWLQESLAYGLQRATVDRFVRYSDLRNKRSTTSSIHLEFSGPQAPVQYDLEVKKAAGKYTRPIVIGEKLRIGKTNGQQSLISSTKGAAGPAVRNILDANPERDGDRLALQSAPKQTGPAVLRVRDFLRQMVVLRLSPTSMTKTVVLEPNARGPIIDEEGRGLPALLQRLTGAQRRQVRQNVAKVISGVESVKVVETTRNQGYFATSERMLSRGGTKRYDIPTWMLSEGTRRMTALFALLAVDPPPSLLLIEEVENGLDPWTLEHVLGELRAATRRGIQIVITTHSPFLLDHVSPEEVIHVRRERGDSTYTPIKDYADVVRYGNVVAPGAMYLAGYLAPAVETKVPETVSESEIEK